jgi:hypothetical protein
MIPSPGSFFRSGRLAGAVVALVALATVASAQTATQSVYFTGPSNQISKINFDTGAITPVVTDSGTNFKGLVVRSDAAVQRLIVANSTQGGDIRIYNSDGTDGATIVPFPSAEGLALATSGDLFAVNADPGGADVLVLVPRDTTCDTAPSAGCRPGGYRDAIVLDQIQGVDLLADVRWAPTAQEGWLYGAGDVLVLVNRPAALLRYTRDFVTRKRLGEAPDPADHSPYTVAVDFAGTAPTGLALTPSGQILVSTQQGRVLRFGPAASSCDAGTCDFVSSVGGSAVGIAVGLQKATSTSPGLPEAFVTVHNGGSVNRYKINADGTGSPDGAVSANSPSGVGNASLTDAIFTPTSNTPVTILPNGIQELTFEKVTKAGVTTSRVFLIPDPIGATRVRTLSELMTLNGGSLATLGMPDRKIPAYVKPFSRAGTPTLVLVVVASGAESIGATQEHHIEEEALGFDTTCGATVDLPDQPRTFYATDADDPAIIEGTSFTDISSGCGSNIGRGGQTSAILTAADTRTNGEVASAKLSTLQSVISSKSAGSLASFIGGAAKNKLSGYLKTAVKLLGTNPQGSIDNLESFVSYVECNPGSFKNNTRNVSGELVARARSTQFIACETIAGKTVTECNRKLETEQPPVCH